MSSSSIWSIAFSTRPDLAASLSDSILPSAFGTICRDTPNLSFSQPHLPGVPPPAVSLVQNSSISCWVSQPTKKGCRLGEPLVGIAVQRDEPLAFQLELNGHNPSLDPVDAVTLERLNTDV